MRSVVRFVAAIMKAALVALATAPRLVWDGVRWVARSMSGGAPGQAAAAQAEAVAELQAAADEATQNLAAPAASATAAPSADASVEWGQAALRFLAGQRRGVEGTLDEPALAYLGALSPEQQARLAAHPARRIGEHLLRERRIASLPEPEDMAGWRKAELARLCRLSLPEPVLRVDPWAGLPKEARSRPAPAFA
ncbi:hypothetical protein [Methylobacterium hispanicum]|uniref:hypothetical protein n=1 Tax=Methylobacterium hispanicum TaxID=270350 RepID=UPI002F2E6475